MNFLMRLFGDLLQDRTRALAERGLRKAALLVAATIILVAGFVMVMAAAYLALVPLASPPIAALVVALGFAIVGGFLLWLARTEGDTRSQGKPEPHDFSGLERQFGGFIKENPKSALLWAVIAGVAVGVSPELRRTLLALLTPPNDEGSGRDQ